MGQLCRKIKKQGGGMKELLTTKGKKSMTIQEEFEKNMDDLLKNIENLGKIIDKFNKELDEILQSYK